MNPMMITIKGLIFGRVQLHYTRKQPQIVGNDTDDDVLKTEKNILAS